MNYETQNHELEWELENETAHESHHEVELEDELSHESLHEDELTHEFEDELSHESLHEGAAHESLPEFEDELSHESLHEGGAHELLHEDELAHEFEFEDELTHESLHEDELAHEQGEQFFKRAFRGIGRIVKTAAPMLRSIAKVAAPVLAKAVGGVFGGPAGALLAGKLASLATRALEAEQHESLETHEFHEMHESHEVHEAAQHELEQEAAHELGAHEAHAELMAHFAAQSAHEFESEALVGGAVTMMLSAGDRAALRRLVPALVRGAAILTRLLRMRQATRPMVRVVPTIIRRTAGTLIRGARSGRPITLPRAGRVLAAQTQRVLSSPRLCGVILRRNLRLAGPLSRRFTRRVTTI